jgi:hypothetical protein
MTAITRLYANIPRVDATLTHGKREKRPEQHNHKSPQLFESFPSEFALHCRVSVPESYLEVLWKYSIINVDDGGP